MEPHSGSKASRRGQATRARLIEATLSVVREVGYAHASTRTIAEAAGVAEGTIYRHFPDKTALFFAAVLESNSPILDWVSALPDRAGRDTVEENLTAALVRLASLQDHVLPLELAIQADPELAAQRRRALEEHDGLPAGPPEAIAAYITAEQRLGRLRADVEPTDAALVILAALFGMAATLTQRDEGLGLGRIASAVRIFVRGIGPSLSAS